MEVEKLLEILQELAPDMLNRGFVNLDSTEESLGGSVNKIGVCIDPTERNIYRAVEKGIELLISYHPWTGELRHLVSKNIKIIPLHTAWDNPTNGINHTFAVAIGLENIQFTEGIYTGTTDLLFRGLLEQCQRVLELNVFPYYGDLKFPVSKVGIWAGPGFLPQHQKIWDICRSQECDTIISGELSLLPIRYAAAHRLKLVDLGHSAIAKPGMSHLAELLKSRLESLECSIEFLDDYYTCNFYTKSQFLHQFEPDESLPLFSLAERLE